MHQAAYRALELDCRYETVDAPDEQSFRALVEALRRGEVAGANVTIPHKRLALQCADRSDPSAERVGAANVLLRAADGAVVAHNTDVVALAGELRAREPDARVACVIGNGGAALASVAACSFIGVEQVGVVARSWRAGVSASLWPGMQDFRQLGALLIAWPERFEAAQVEEQGVLPNPWEAFLACSQLIIQATSAGMRGAGAGESVRDIVPWLTLKPTTFAYDLVYNPAVTPFLEAGRAAGLQVEGGLGMLVEQAALSVQLWLGVSPPRSAMREAAELFLAAQGPP
jgi:shikimate dehydrogenase